MVGSVNKVILLGRLGKDPDIRSMQNGKKIANFSIATSKRWTDRDTQEKKEKTSWHNVVVFNEGLVGIVEQYVKKGSQIYVEGELQTRKWQDQEGKDRYTTEVVLQNYTGNLTLLGQGELNFQYNFEEQPRLCTYLFPLDLAIYEFVIHPQHRFETLFLHIVQLFQLNPH